MTREALYDGLAEWYDATCATGESAMAARDAVLRLLGPGPGGLLDIGCGTGSHTAAFAEAGWSVVGVDLSEDQLRLARERGCEVVRADATALPFPDASFDAAASICTHTDVGDFGAVLREAHRVLKNGQRLVYVGVHPCFVGRHSEFVRAEGVPVLHSGYLETGRYASGPGISPEGLRARVGAVHLPLGVFVQAFLEVGFRLERFEELDPAPREYPHLVLLKARR